MATEQTGLSGPPRALPGDLSRHRGLEQRAAGAHRGATGSPARTRRTPTGGRRSAGGRGQGQGRGLPDPREARGSGVGFALRKQGPRRAWHCRLPQLGGYPLLPKAGGARAERSARTAHPPPRGRRPAPPAHSRGPRAACRPARRRRLHDHTRAGEGGPGPAETRPLFGR